MPILHNNNSNCKNTNKNDYAKLEIILEVCVLILFFESPAFSCL